MKIILDDFVGDELKHYLMLQDGIEDVKLINKDSICEVNIRFNHRTTPKIIKNYIYLFQENECPVMMEFNKTVSGKHKTLKYIVDDMCCEYCYKGLVEDLFDNDFIISVKSNFDINKLKYNIEFSIEYSDSYDEIKLIQYIKQKIGL